MQIRRGYLGSDQCQLALKGPEGDPAAPLMPIGSSAPSKLMVV